MLLEAIPQNKIALRTTLANLLKAKPYNHETFMNALDEYTQQHVNLVLGDLLAEMERGAWRDSFRGTLDPSGGGKAFYEAFPQEALLALLKKASRTVALAALQMPLRGWPSSVIERLVCYRTANQTKALADLFPDAITARMCETFLESISYLGTEGPQKWIIIFNKIPADKASTIINGYYESAQTGVRRYQSNLNDFWSLDNVNMADIIPYLDINHLAIMYGVAQDDYYETSSYQLNRFMRTTLTVVEPTFKYKSFGSLTLLYKRTDSDEELQQLIKSAINDVNEGCWPHRYKNENGHAHKKDFEQLLRTMVNNLAPASHWKIILDGIPTNARFALLERLIPQAAGFVFHPKYTPSEFFDILEAWAGDDKRLALKITCMVGQKLVPDDCSEYSLLQSSIDEFDQTPETTLVQDLLKAFAKTSGWEEFIQKLQEQYPEITTTTTSLALFSKKANEVTGNGATLEGGVKLGEFAAMKSNNVTSSNTPKAFELRAFSELKNKK